MASDIASEAAPGLGLDWDDLRFFAELSRTGSLSAAARRLKVDHSTVARRVASLETSLGVRLFDRLPRGWVLTADGEQMAERVERLETEIFALGSFARGRSGALSGSVRVSAPPGLCRPVPDAPARPAARTPPRHRDRDGRRDADRQPHPPRGRPRAPDRPARRRVDGGPAAARFRLRPVRAGATMSSACPRRIGPCSAMTRASSTARPSNGCATMPPAGRWRSARTT